MSGASGDVSALLHELRNRLMPMQLRIDAGQHLAAGTSLESLMSSLHSSMRDVTALVDAMQTAVGSPTLSGAPHKAEPTASGDAPPDQAPTIPHQPIHLLLVDDNEVLAEALTDFALADARIGAVRLARNAAEAWHQLAAHQPHVVVLDVHLPDDDGVALCAAMRARYPNVPVALMSGMVDEALLDATQRAGAAGFIAKGCDPRATLDAFVRATQGVWTTLLP
ncbi:MAG TPA: response regulator transcription factor [Gemmatimonas sp.]|uniref:response regulator transcription factor n=1 Tax=Gemmatimonas sp. TaxID=1962908 RepID=UPI002EDA0AA2